MGWVQPLQMPLAVVERVSGEVVRGGGARKGGSLVGKG